MNKRRISSCQQLPKCTSESTIDDVYFHEGAAANFLRVLDQRSKPTYIDNLDGYKVENNHRLDSSQSNDISLKTLGLTCDDYVEQRVPQYNYDDLNYASINNINFVKYSNEVSIISDILIYENKFNCNPIYDESLLDRCQVVISVLFVVVLIVFAY